MLTPPIERPRTTESTGRTQLRLRRCVAALYLGGAGVHIWLATLSSTSYRPFADGALFGFVREGWGDVFMASPTAWALLLAAGEALLGTLLLLGGSAARVGYVGVISFHVALMLFGWGFWLWSIPSLVFLLWLAHREWASLGQPRVPAERDSRP